MPWVKGQSGNPAGRPRETPLTTQLRRQLRERGTGGQWTNAHLIAWQMIQRAQCGDVAAARLIWEYVEGRPVQPVTLEIRTVAQRLADEHGLDVTRLLERAEAIAGGRL